MDLNFEKSRTHIPPNHFETLGPIRHVVVHVVIAMGPRHKRKLGDCSPLHDVVVIAGVLPDPEVVSLHLILVRAHFNYINIVIKLTGL